MRQIKLWSIAIATCFMPVSAIALPPTQLNSTILAQTERLLTGRWLINTKDSIRWVNADPRNCYIEPNTQSEYTPLNITQNGNQLIITAPPAFDEDTVTISSNQFSIEDDFGQRWTGIIGSSRNQFTGTITCGAVTLPFTAIREGSQASGSAPQEPIKIPTSDNGTPNSNESEMLW